MSSFTITSANGNSVVFDSKEATDTGETKPYYSINRGAEESAGGIIKQQIRPGKRYNKTYEMNLDETKYVNFINMLTDQSDDFYITYDTVPSLLEADSSISTTNDFKVSLNMANVNANMGDPIVYKFSLAIQSVNLL